MTVGMTWPMKNVTQVRPRKLSDTENSRLAMRRMGPAMRRTHPTGTMPLQQRLTAGPRPYVLLAVR